MEAEHKKNLVRLGYSENPTSRMSSERSASELQTQSCSFQEPNLIAFPSMKAKLQTSCVSVAFAIWDTRGTKINLTNKSPIFQ